LPLVPVLGSVAIDHVLDLIAVYIVFLFKTDRVPQDKKALWAAVLFRGTC
jgi:hypothetical protein